MKRNGLNGLLVDTSNNACLMFGFGYKEKIIDPNGRKGEVLGVVNGDGVIAGIKTLWYSTQEGIFWDFFWGHPQDLRKKGFKLAE